MYIISSFFIKWIMRSSIQSRIDIYIAFAIGAQSLLVILQQILLDLLYFDEGVATLIRVALTMGTMGPAIFLSAIRKPVLFISTYMCFFAILLLTILFYPANETYIIDEGLRFLLPVSIPSCLCLIAIRDYSIFEKTLYRISIATSALVFVYVIGFFLGLIYFEKYNMSFGYACLLPMTILYYNNNKVSKLISFILLAVVIALGSRGPAMVFILYVILDIILYDKKKMSLLVGFSIIAILILPLFVEMLEGLGIESRTISMVLEGNVISDDSGRDDIYKPISRLIFSEPFGHGIYGDRVILNGAYCHNFFIELFYDFGIIGGGIICLWLFSWFTSVYLRSDKLNRRRLLLFSVVVFVPLMASGSFLKDYNFGLLMGVIYSINKINHNVHVKFAPKTRMVEWGSKIQN